MTNITLATTNIFFSIILGAIFFVLCGLNFPHMVSIIQDGASGLVDIITNIGIPVEYNIWVKFVLQDQTFVLMFFIILARVVLAILGSIFSSLFSVD